MQIGLEAAGGTNLEVPSPTVGRQFLEPGLINEIDLHVAPVLLGEGIRLHDNRQRADPPAPVGEGDPMPTVNVGY